MQTSIQTPMQYQFKKLDLKPGVKSFFKALQDWVDKGCPFNNPQRFNPYYGLCANAFNPYDGWDYRLELEAIFWKNDLCREFPFNKDFMDYTFEAKYNNPMRLAFIKFYSED